MLYEVVFDQRYFGQQVINRFNYVSSGTPAVVSASFALVTAMGWGGGDGYSIPDLGITFQEQWRVPQVAALTYVEIICKAIYDVTDFYTLPLVPPMTGLDVAAAGMSPTTAMGWRSNRVRSDIGRGMKRMAGISEASVAPGGVLESGALGWANQVVIALTSPLIYDDEGNIITFTPCIVKKQKYTPVGSTKPAYRYFPDEAEQMENLAQGISWQPYTQVRTQSSRQYGHGA